MKSIFVLIFAVIMFQSAKSQVDTIYTRDKAKIPCKITEINEYEIKYKIGSDDGPVTLIDKSKVYKYSLSTGYTEIVKIDPSVVYNQDLENQDCRIGFKIHPFSAINNQVSLAYEQVLKYGTNIDVEAGYVNSSINQSPAFGGEGGYNGFYLRPGIKFLVGSEMKTKGLKFSHPMRGKYIRFDLVFSNLNYDGINQYNYYAGPGNGTISFNTRRTSYAGGLMVSVGKQFILGDYFTMDYFFGAGYTMSKTKYLDPSFNSLLNGTNNSYYNMVVEQNEPSNYHAFMRIPNVGISLTAGFRIGFIIPYNSAKTTNGF